MCNFFKTLSPKNVDVFIDYMIFLSKNIYYFICKPFLF